MTEAIRTGVDVVGAAVVVVLTAMIHRESLRLPPRVERPFLRFFSGFLLLFALSRFLGHAVVPAAETWWEGARGLLPFTGALNTVVFAALAAAALFDRQTGQAREVLVTEKDRLREELEASQADLRTHRDRLSEALATTRSILEGVVKRRDYSRRFPNPAAVPCWELLSCEAADCPAYGVEQERCWRLRGTGREFGSCRGISCAECPVRARATGDEIADLAEMVNDLLYLLEHHAQEEKLYLSALSHDIRGPLGSVKGFLDLLEAGDPPLTPSQAEMVSLARFSLQRVMHLAENLTIEGRAQAGELKPSVRPVAVEDLIRRMGREFEARARLRGSPVRMPDTPRDPTVVEADPVLIARALANLVDNALKHTPRGTPVTIRVERGGASVRIGVEDLGPGVPEAKRREIFLPYRGLSRRKGSGLGLFVVDAVCRAHGGRAWVEPGPGGRGSRFWMEIPVGRTPSR